MEGKLTAHLGILVLAAVVGGGYFLWPHIAQATPDHLVISQVQITGGSGHTNDDFIELFNPTAAPVDLKGFRLVKRTATGTADVSLKSWTSSTVIPAYGFYLWANSGFTTLAVAPDAATSESLADNNGVALRQGAADTGTIIDSLAWGSASNAFVEGSPFPTNPPANQTLLRQTPDPGSRQDTDNNSQDFTLQTAPSLHNNSSAPELTTTSGTDDKTTPITASPVPTSNVMSSTTPQNGEVVINELVSDPADGSEEWVELYNRSSRFVNLDDCALIDGSGAVTALSGSLGGDGLGRFTVIRAPKGNLNNDGDAVILKCHDQIIDQVTYGKWDDGSPNDNAPVAHDPLAIGRLPDGTDTNNDQNDFVLTQPTFGQPNQAATIENKTAAANQPQLQFNELYPNPPLGDEQGEFIELVNHGTAPIDLNGWIIADEISHYTITNTHGNTVLATDQYFVLPRPQTGIALDNTGTEHVTLTSPDGQTTLRLAYDGPAPAGASYARDDTNHWQWSLTPTPGATNTLTPINQPPHLVLEAPKTGAMGELIMFDASDSIDPEGSLLTFQWDFGDGTTSQFATPSHAFGQTGKFTVHLTAYDKDNILTNASHVITIATTGEVAGAATGPLILSELMPNPVGSDSAEWVEIFNPGDTTTNLTGWQLVVNNRRTNLPDQSIPAGAYVVVPTTLGHFSLLNSNATITLESNLVSSQAPASYNQAPEGQTLAWLDGQWQWTTTPTPGQSNQVATEATDGINNDYPMADLSEARNLDHGAKVTVAGTLASPLGPLGKTTSFLVDNGNWLQVSLSGQGWPGLKAGDRVRLFGTMSKTSTGTKLLVRTPKALTVLGRDQLPEPTAMALGDLGEEDEGKLVQITGQLTKLNKVSFILSDDQDNIRLTLRDRSAALPPLAVGSQITAIGFAVLQNGAPQLWLASPAKLATSAPLAPTPATTVDLTGPAENNSTSWPNYLFLGLVLVIGGGAYAWERNKLPAFLRRFKKTP